ncbi:MAG: head-tail adaptor protein [Rhodobacteraceae bacterium]|nr:head-tail adaptor protein [Paracoccaceae bacterium]
MPKRFQRRGFSLNRRLELEAIVRNPDLAGGYVESWISVGTLWGAVDARTAAIGAVAGGEVARVRYRVVVRAAPQGSTARPVPGQRFREQSRLFLIDAVSEQDASGLFLECWAHEEELE